MQCAVHAQHVSEAWWKEACKKAKNSTVFIDNAVAECLHWNGGLAKLLDTGAKHVKEFSSFESGGKDEKKAVFMVSAAVRGTIASIIQDILQASSFEYCVVISSAHPHVHAYARYGGRETDEAQVMNQIEQDILSWMGNVNYTAEIIYIPLVIVPYIEGVFLMPTFQDIFPLLSSDVPQIIKLQESISKGERSKVIESLGDVEFNHLTLELRTLYRQFVVCLNSLLQGMNAREEIFTIGHTARMIGADLDAFGPAKQRRKTALNKLSVVLVDRTLDLVGPSSHSGETIMERILALLPRLFGHILDSAVSMAPICHVHKSAEWSLVPGCIAPQGEKIANEVFVALNTSTTKEALNLLNKHVLNVVNRKDTAAGGEIKITAENLKKNILPLASDVDDFLENACLVQQVLGIAEVLDHPNYSHLDQIYSLEKLLLQSILDPDEIKPFTQIFQLLKNRANRSMSLDDLIILMIYVTSMGGEGTFTQSDEDTLINLLSHAIVEDRNVLSDTMVNLIASEIDEVSALNTAKNIAQHLYAVAGARNHLRNYKSLHIPGSDVQPAEFHGLLKQLIQDCLIAPQQDMNDLEYKSAGLKDLIKTGFSLFVTVTKPMPRDSPMMIIFVLGGISPGEIKEVREVVSMLNPRCQVVIASTHLSSPSDTLLRTLKPNKYLYHM